MGPYYTASNGKINYKGNKIFPKIEDKLNSRNQQLYYDLFFGSKKYPLWSGYSIGYYIVQNYLNKQKKINWNKIIRLDPQIILKESDFK